MVWCTTLKHVVWRWTTLSHTTHVLVLTGNGQVPQIAKEHRDGNTIQKTQQNDLNVRRTFRETQYPCVSLFVNWRHHDRGAKKHAAMSQLCKTSTAGSSHNMAHIVHMGVSEHGLYQNTTISLFAAFTQAYMGSKPTGVVSSEVEPVPSYLWSNCMSWK